MKYAILLMGLICLPVVKADEERKVKVTVKEQNGSVVPNASVEIIFMCHTADDTQRAKGLTDTNGVIEAIGEPRLYMYVNVSKDGYYKAYSSQRLRRKIDHNVTYVLHKKINPIALYAKHEGIGLPMNREWVGYDFIIGDWVAPHGKGVMPHIKMKCDTKSTAPMEGSGSLEIDFGAGGGAYIVEDEYILNSELRMPHEAPRKGYQRFLKRVSKSYHDRNKKHGIGYFFRVPVTDFKGSAPVYYYGKIAEDIGFVPVKSGWHVSDEGMPVTYGGVRFTFYLNPTPNDRNLEFDPQKNLFQALDPVNQVHAP